METKPILYGLVGFILGGLLVSVAATTFNKPTSQTATTNSHSATMSMSDMTASLATKTGDDYDDAFIHYMIDHHQSAVDMAKLSANRATHDEIKQLSSDIMTAQQKEIQGMRQWQSDWGYATKTQQNGHETMHR